jgi:tetratricopeptide (TPR) repeat protein
MNRYEDALEWGKMAVEITETQPSSYQFAYMTAARAYAGLRQFDTALKHIEESYKMALKQGEELGHVYQQFVLGLIELAQGNLSEAFSNFESALEIAESLGFQHWINSCLLRLAETEIEAYFFEGEVSPSEDRDTYLTRLEVRARERGYLGILGLGLIMKAQLRIKQEQVEEAVRLIKEAQGLAKQPGLRFLEEKISVISEIIEL